MTVTVTVRVEVPIRHGVLSLADLRDIVEQADTMPEETVVTVDHDSIYVEVIR